MPLHFSEQPETGLVAVTLTDEDGAVRQTRVVTGEELQRVVARARALAARPDGEGWITLDELIDGPNHGDAG